MKTILFNAGHFSMRGTGVALYDYACGNERILGNRSLVTIYADAEHDPSMLQKFSSRFELLRIERNQTLDDVVRSTPVDLVYSIDSGADHELPTGQVPCMLHAVFRTQPNEFRGASFAYVSDWLSQYCSNGCIPAVPHMISLPGIDEDLRDALGIPPTATVFGGMGGTDSFDLAFARRVVHEVAAARDDIWFLFLNIAPFTAHPRIRFLPGSGDMLHKVRFINSCDAMLHARQRGETFGLACGEFSARNKPVITYGCSGERHHLDVLGDKALCFYGPRTLRKLLLGFDRDQAREGDWDCYSDRFSPEHIMARFDQHLIRPALANGPGASMTASLGTGDKLACMGKQLNRRGHRLSRFWRDWTR